MCLAPAGIGNVLGQGMRRRVLAPTLPVAGAVLWLSFALSPRWQDAGQTTPAGVGNPLHVWKSLAGTNDAIAPNTGVRPSVVSDGISFDGSTYLAISNILAGASSAFTLFIVVRLNPSASGFGAIVDTLLRVCSLLAPTVYDVAYGMNFNNTSIVDSTMAVITIKATKNLASGAKKRRNQGAWNTGNAGSTHASQDVFLGKNESGGGTGGKFTTRGMAFYPTELSNGDCDAVINFLTALEGV